MQSPVAEAIAGLHSKVGNRLNISLDELLIVQSIAKIEELKPDSFFIRAGESSEKLALLIKGMAKTYYILENGKEVISQFVTEGSFLGIYTDMLKGVPSTGYAVAIEPCTLLVMNYRQLLDITKGSLAWAHFLRALAEERYIDRSEKERNISLKTAEAKYDYFTKVHPELIERLPGNQIALYLNITPATLSRLRNKSGKYSKS